MEQVPGILALSNPFMPMLMAVFFRLGKREREGRTIRRLK